VKVVKPSHFRDVQTWRAVPRCAWSIRIFLLLARSFCSTSCRSSSFERFDFSLFAMPMPMCKTELSVWRCSSGCCKTSAKSVVFWVKGATSLTWLAWLTCLTWLAWLTSVTMCISMCIEDFGSTCCGDHWIIDPATRYPAQQAWWGRGSAACTASPRYWRGRVFCGCTAESSMIYAGGLYVSLCPGTSVTVWLCVRDLSPFHILSYPFINFNCSCLADSVIPNAPLYCRHTVPISKPVYAMFDFTDKMCENILDRWTLEERPQNTTRRKWNQHKEESSKDQN